MSLDYICGIIFLIFLAVGTLYVIYFIIFKPILFITRKAEEKYEDEKNKVRSLENELRGCVKSVEGSLNQFFSYEHVSYEETYKSMNNCISSMKLTSEEYKKIAKKDFVAEINRCEELGKNFYEFWHKVGTVPKTCMIDESNYGKARKEYWDSVQAMSKNTAEGILDLKNYINSKAYKNVMKSNITADMAMKCVWFYAIQKPFSREKFEDAVFVFRRISRGINFDTTIAELYSMKQVGGEAVLRKRIDEMIKEVLDDDRLRIKEALDVDRLRIIASALMWMNAYQSENKVLQTMLESGMPMDAKLQERLHSLTNGGGKAPSGHDVSSDIDTMYFDVSSLAWKDEDYNGLFENLAFEEKMLSYSLAIRDEDKELFITQNINTFGMSAILKKLKAVFTEEYGNGVIANMKNCIALSGNGEEQLEGIVIMTSECRQLGVLVHVARIGKKINIKFYTLFMPAGMKLAEQKQQAISMSKKLSPAVTMWESSIKDTTLMAIQQLLNETPQETSGTYTTNSDSNGPIF